MTTLWSNYKTVSNETIKSLRPLFKDRTDEEIKETVRSNAEDELKRIQAILDKLYPGPVHILVVSLSGRYPYYITKYHTTGRELICHTKGQDCHYFWDNGNLQLHTENHDFIIRFISSIEINNLWMIKQALENKELSIQDKMTLIEPLTAPVPELKQK